VAIRELIQKNASKHLEPGETIQAVFSAQTGPNPNFAALTWLIAFFAKYVTVIATDRRILLVKSSIWRRSAVGDVMETYPRETKLGPATGKLWSKIELGGNQYWVHRRFSKDVAAADARLQTSAAEPATA
jgi:hypothetical protein